MANGQEYSISLRSRANQRSQLRYIDIFFYNYVLLEIKLKRKSCVKMLYLVLKKEI